MKIKSNYFIALASVMTIGTAAAQNIVHVGNVTNTGTVTNTGNVTNTGTLTNVGAATVNGTLTVQPAIATTTTNTPTPSGIGATNPDAGSFGPATAGSTRIVTVLGGVDGTFTTNTGGGAEIQTNGDTILRSATGETTQGSYTRLTTVDVYNADQGVLAGTPVPGTQKYFAAYPNPSVPGTYLPLTPEFATPALLDAFVADTPITDAVFAPLALTPQDLAATGGNLTVEGDTQLDGDLNVDGATTTNGINNVGNVETDTLNVSGMTTTNGINNTGDRITNLAAGIAPTDAVNVGQLNFETNARIAADDQLRSDYQSADRRLRGDIDQNTRGIAMVAAMTNTKVEAGKTHGVDFNIAQFQDETGMSFGYANRINENLQIHAAAASTTDFDEAVARIGVSYQW